VKDIMAKTITAPWRVEDYLETADDIVAYLEAVFEDGDPQLINHAVGAIARSKGMTEVAQRTGLGRQSLYKALSRQGQPEFTTVLKVIQALGMRLTVTLDPPKRPPRASARKARDSGTRKVGTPRPKTARRVTK
jgi:probable addiction module antidote protein